MTNVIPFADRASSRDPLELAEKEKKQASDRVRADQIHQKILANPMMNRPTDRFQVAKNLGLIFDEMEKKGCRRASLLQKIGRAQKIDSTKILYNYTLSSDAEFEQSIDRVRKLTRKANKYLDLAKAAADEIKVERDLIVLQLFQNTTYEVTDEISEEQITYLQEINKLLTAIADAARKRFDLSAYKEVLSSNKIGWDIDGSFGHFQCLPYSVWLEDRTPRHVGYLGYVPSVFLYSQWVGPQPYDAISGQAFQIDFENSPQALTDYFERKRPLPKKHCMTVRVHIASEIWFGLAPLQSTWQWEPVFEKRFRFEIDGNERSNRWVQVRTYDPSFLFEAHVSEPPQDDFPHRLGWLNYFLRFPKVADDQPFVASVSPHLDDQETWSLSAGELTREMFEGRWLISLDGFDSKALDFDQDVTISKGQFFYERVSLDSCAKYLRPVHDEADWRNFEDYCRGVNVNTQLWPEYEQREAWFTNFSSEGWPLMHTVAPPGSIALAIEQNLLGAAESRLDTLLFKAVEKRIGGARAYYESRLSKRDQKIARLLSSWES